MKIKTLALTALLFLTGCASNNSYINSRQIILENRVYSIQKNELKEKSFFSYPIKFGVVSDIHNEGEKAKKIAKRFQEQRVDAIIIAGDISRYFGDYEHIPESVEIRNSIIHFLETKKPVYVIAGNHETRDCYFRTISKLTKDYNNLFDLSTLKYADLNGVNIFGVSGGTFFLPLGGFSVKQEIKSIDDAVFSLDNDPILMLSHVPPRFNHKGAIDCNYNIKINKTFKLGKKVFKKGKVISNRHVYEDILAGRADITKTNSRNSGLKELTNLIIKHNIQFSISGHYPTNQGANDLKQNLEQGKYYNQLFMNPGGCQYGMADILTINKNKAKYELLKIK